MAGPLSLLGFAINQGTRDFADQAIRDRVRAELRTQQLEDIQSQRDFVVDRYNVRRAHELEDIESARGYEGEIYDRNRADHLSDVQDNRLWESYVHGRNSKEARDQAVFVSDLQIKQALVQSGFLSPNDMDDDVAVSEAFARAQNDGWVQRMDEAIKAGFINPSEVGDEARRNEAMGKLQEYYATLRERGDAMANNAVATAEANQQRQAELGQQLTYLRQNPPQFEAPTGVQIQSYAEQLAAQMKPGEAISDEDIQMQMAAAQEALNEAANVRFQVASQAHQMEMSAILGEMRYLGSASNAMTNQGVFADPGRVDLPPLPTGPPATTPPPPSGGFMDELSANTPAAPQGSLDRILSSDAVAPIVNVAGRAGDVAEVLTNPIGAIPGAVSGLAGRGLDALADYLDPQGAPVPAPAPAAPAPFSVPTWKPGSAPPPAPKLAAYQDPASLLDPAPAL